MKWLLIQQDPEIRCFPKITPKIINAHIQAARTVFNAFRSISHYAPLRASRRIRSARCFTRVRGGSAAAFTSPAGGLSGRRQTSAMRSAMSIRRSRTIGQLRRFPPLGRGWLCSGVFADWKVSATSHPPGRADPDPGRRIYADWKVSVTSMAPALFVLIRVHSWLNCPETPQSDFARRIQAPRLVGHLVPKRSGTQGDILILRSFIGAPALSRKRMAPCQLFCSLRTLNTMTLTPAFRVTLPLSASSMRGRASVNA